MRHRMPWRELSGRTRRLLILGAAFETTLKAVALVDLLRRPPSDIRGSKSKWAVAVLFINSAGAVPIAYLAYGRHAHR